MRLKLCSGLLLSALVVFAGDVPRRAPPLELPVFNGPKLSLASLRGKVVLLKFFLTECQHCQRTARVIMPMYNEWRSRGLEVVGVAINPDAPKLIPSFIRRFGVTYPITVGDRSTLTTFADISAVAKFYVPYIFMVDRKGVIRREHPGQDEHFYHNEEQNMRAELDELLRQPAQARKTIRKAPPKN